MKYKDYLYGAYGSNLNLEQMYFRCPHSEVMGSMTLHGWKLKFSGVADVAKSKNDTVPLGLYRITEDCENALDIYEGYPYLYRKEILTVNGIEEKLGTDKVMIYVMNRGETYPPSMPYLNCIIEGYRDFGLDEEYLQYAIKDAYAREASYTPKPKKKRLRLVK